MGPQFRFSLLLEGHSRVGYLHVCVWIIHGLLGLIIRSAQINPCESSRMDIFYEWQYNSLIWEGTVVSVFLCDVSSVMMKLSCHSSKFNAKLGLWVRKKYTSCVARPQNYVQKITCIYAVDPCAFISSSVSDKHAFLR